MRTNQWTVVVGLAVVILGFLLFRNVRERMDALSPDPRGGSAQAALDGAALFHDAVTSGKSGRVCRLADINAFQSMTGFPCAQFVNYLHDKLGKAIGSNSAVPPAVMGARVILDMMTHYDSGDAREHFEYSISGSTATLTNYRIQSEALNH